jgi:cardiolipin synthase
LRRDPKTLAFFVVLACALAGANARAAGPTPPLREVEIGHPTPPPAIAAVRSPGPQRPGGAAGTPLSTTLRGRVPQAIREPVTPRPVTEAGKMTSANIRQAIALRHAGSIPEKALPTLHPISEGNDVELLVDGTRAYPRILDDLSHAKDSIHISAFAVGNDKLGNEVGAILMAKARSGVEVRVLMDPLGSGNLLHVGSTERMLQQWEKAGVQVIRNYLVDPLRPAEVLNHPEHRKFYVIDGAVAYTGGMGIQDKYVAPWHDVMIRVKGGGTHQMQVDFLKIWQHLGGRIDQKGGSDEHLQARFFPETGSPGTVPLQGTVQIPGESPRIREAYLREIESAKTSFWIENPYVTDRRVLNALERAAQRGVDVRVVLPGRSDNFFTMWAGRAQYGKLIKAGIRVYEYDGMTHAKVAVRDGQWATVGSANLDSLGMNHLYEFNFQTSDKKVADEVHTMIHTDMNTKAREMHPEDIPVMGKAFGKFLNFPLIGYFL